MRIFGGTIGKSFFITLLGFFIFLVTPLFAQAATIPNAPGGLKVEESSEGRVSITWDKVEKATGYKVYVECKEDDKKWDFRTNDNQFALKNLGAGKTYRFYVTTLSEVESGDSGVQSVTIGKQDVPDVPQGLEVKESSPGRVTVTWDKVNEATSYKVYVECREDNKKWDFKSITNEFKLMNLGAGKIYRFSVTALNGKGESEASALKSLTISKPDVPNAPKGLGVEEGLDGRVTITWDKVEGVTGYKVYLECKTDDKKWNFGASTNELKLKNLGEGKEYQFYVTALNKEGESEASSKKTITISKSKIPNAPKGLKTTKTSDGGLKISWEASSGATGYEVYYKWNNETEFRVYETTQTFCTIKNLAEKDKYEVFVKATNSAGISEASVSKKRDSDDRQKPTTPQTLMGSLEKEGSIYNVRLIWEPSEDNIGVEGYRVYRFNPDNSSEPEKKWTVAADDFAEGKAISTLDKSVPKGQLYLYVVEAYDYEGNTSSFSKAVEISTK